MLNVDCPVIVNFVHVVSVCCSLAARSEALEMGQELLKRHFCRHVADDHEFKDEYLFYRFVEDNRRSALNMSYVSDCEPYTGKMTCNFCQLLLDCLCDWLKDWLAIATRCFCLIVLINCLVAVGVERCF